MLYKRSVLKNVSKFTDKHKKQSPGGDLSKEKMFLKIQQNSQQIILSGVSLLIKLQTGNQKPTEAATGDALKIFANFTGNNLCWSLFKSAYLVPATLSKYTLTQVLSCKICNYFKEHLCMSTCQLQNKYLFQNFVNYLGTPVLQMIFKRLVLKHQCTGVSKVDIKGVNEIANQAA